MSDLSDKLANEVFGEMPGHLRDDEAWRAARAAVVAVLRELSQRPEEWNRYELTDLAREIEEAGNE